METALNLLLWAFVLIMGLVVTGLILVGGPYVIYRIIKKNLVKPVLYCKHCGHVGKTKKAMRGSLGVEFVLWLCFLLPGLIYSIWRGGTNAPICEKCGSFDVIPTDSPLARGAVPAQ